MDFFISSFLSLCFDSLILSNFQLQTFSFQEAVANLGGPVIIYINWKESASLLLLKKKKEIKATKKEQWLKKTWREDRKESETISKLLQLILYHWRFSIIGVIIGVSVIRSYTFCTVSYFSQNPRIKKNKTKTTRIKPVWYDSRQLILTFRTKENKAYQLDIGFQNTLIYCHMNDTGLGACGGGGWTLVMKIDGNQVQSLIFTSFVLIWYN